MGLEITDQAYYDDVVSQIKELDDKHEGKYDLMKKFEERIEYLRNYGDDRFSVELSRDWAPLSFSIIWKMNGEFFMNGGLIFHNGAGFEDGTLSVEVAPTEGPHWSIHT